MSIRGFRLLPVLFWPLAAQTVSVPLTVEAGVPLRVYLTQRLGMRVGASAAAKLIDPIYAFDRIVIPADAELSGHITQLDPVSKLVRAQAMMGGNFTPLHRARVEFTSVRLPDGSDLPIHTVSAAGLASIYQPPKPARAKKKTSQPNSQNPGLTDVIREQAQQQINARINSQLDARTYGLGSLVRGPNKKERLEDLLLNKLPYRPQWYRRGTRFDMALQEPLRFGTALLPSDALRDLGATATLDRLAEVRFLSTVTSATAKLGDKVEAVLSKPLQDPGNKLLLPEGTRLTGSVRQVRRARWLHRAGQLRFSFDLVILPDAVASLPSRPPVNSDAPCAGCLINARLESAETDPGANVKIDSEGSAKATESKTRLLAPAIAAIIAAKSMDNDSGKSASAGGNGNGNGAGLALGGFSGFGLLGVAASRASHVAGSALGMYGLAFSVYSAVIARGHEVEFPENSGMAVRFAPRPAPANQK